MRWVTKGAADQSVVLRIVDSTDGTPETGVVFNTSGIDLWYRREGAVKTSITEATLSALNDAHSDGGILHIGDGYYRLDLPDAAVATGANGVMVGGAVTAMVVIGCYVPLVDVNPYDAVRMGMTALPNAAADAPGGLPISDAGGLDLDAQRADVAAILVDTGTTLDGRIPAVLVGGRMDANMGAISTDAAAADNAEAFFDGTGYAGTNNVIPTVTTLTGHTPQTGDSFALIGATGSGLTTLASAAALATVDGIVDDILVDTAEIGTAGAGLTNINLPNQTMDIVGNITGNLSGSAGSVTGAVGSVTGAVGSVTGNVGGNVTGTIGGLTAGALKDFFDTDSATTYASAVAGSVVKEIADNAGGASLTVQQIVDGVWDETLASHLDVGSTGAGLNAAGSAGDPWSTAIPGAYGAGTAGKIVGDNLNATVSSRATPAQVNTEADTAIADAALATAAAVADLPTNAEMATSLGTADDATLAAIAALNNLSAAQVNAEVVDALATDTYAEPGQGTPAATLSLAAKLNYVFKAFRNRKTQTALQFSLYADDATTVDQKAAVSDDGTTTAVGELVSGP